MLVSEQHKCNITPVTALHSILHSSPVVSNLAFRILQSGTLTLVVCCKGLRAHHPVGHPAQRAVEETVLQKHGAPGVFPAHAHSRVVGM